MKMLLKSLCFMLSLLVAVPSAQAIDFFSCFRQSFSWFKSKFFSSETKARQQKERIYIYEDQTELRLERENEELKQKARLVFEAESENRARFKFCRDRYTKLMEIIQKKEQSFETRSV